MLGEELICMLSKSVSFQELPWWSSGFGLCTFFFLQRIQVQSLVGELRSCMLCSMAKKLREKKDCEFAELVC